jgi:hypothetical protein
MTKLECRIHLRRGYGVTGDEGMTKFQHLRCLRYLLLKESRTEGNEGNEGGRMERLGGAT